MNGYQIGNSIVMRYDTTILRETYCESGVMEEEIGKVEITFKCKGLVISRDPTPYINTITEIEFNKLLAYKGLKYDDIISTCQDG